MVMATMKTENQPSSLKLEVCDSTIPNYLADCKTYEGKCPQGTIDKIKKYLELRGLSKLMQLYKLCFSALSF
jgi:hypothetical protein